MPTKIEIYTNALQRAEIELKRLNVDFALRMIVPGTDRHTVLTKAVATDYYSKAIEYQQGYIADLRRDLEQAISENTPQNKKPRRSVEELGIQLREARKKSKQGRRSYRPGV